MYNVDIKNMVCPRCISVVANEFAQLNLTVLQIQLGRVVLMKKPNEVEMREIQTNLEKHGFEIIEDKRLVIVEQIKSLIINCIFHKPGLKPDTLNFSDLIAEKIGMEYNYLSSLFSALEHLTIEKYIILQKIERVKELLTYNEKTLSEISYELGYSSVHHLSNQFKKTTGMTPAYFRKLVGDKRNTLDKIGKS